MSEAKDPARERELATTVALYNAATDYAAYVNSNRHDYDEAMKLSSALEAAAVAYAELAGDRQPVMTKTPAISTLASSNGSATPEEWWAKRASELAQQMKVGGVGELRLLRLPTGKYEFEITPEGWPNDPN